MHGGSGTFLLYFIPGFPRVTEETTKNFSQDSSLHAKIWTWNLPNTKQECHPIDHDVRYYVNEDFALITVAEISMK